MENINGFLRSRFISFFLAPIIPFNDGYHSGQIAKGMNDSKYYRGFGLSAGLIFTEGNFVKEVPYDPRIYFGGEETTLAVRAYTHGYELVHVPDTPLWHWYNSDNQELKRELHWDLHEQDELSLIHI